MTTTDRRDADDATFAAEMDRLGRLEVADEDTVERVARAIWDAKEMPADKWTSESPGWAFEREECRAYARAAIAELAAPGTDSSGQATCGHLSPSINFGGDEEAERFMCELPHGHGGAHQRDNGDGLPPMRWVAIDATEQSVQRVLDLADELDRTFTGSSIPNEIRAAVSGGQS